jgi:hypothetical protein
MAEAASALGEFDFAGDDHVVPFQVENLDVRGRAVQLGPMLDAILERHNYPAPVARLLAEVIALTVLLGTSLKFDGKFTVQTKSDGPVDLLVADFSTPENVRAYARFDQTLLDEAVAAGQTEPEQLLGKGMLAFTIDQGKFSQPYQGIVALDGATLEDIAGTYFRQSEQIPTRVRLAAAELFDRDEAGKPRHRWRAGGLSPSSCRKRRSACARPTFMAATAIPALRSIPRTTPGPKPARWSRPSFRRTDGSACRHRTAAVPPVPRARRAGLRTARGVRSLFLLAGEDQGRASGVLC